MANPTHSSLNPLKGLGPRSWLAIACGAVVVGLLIYDTLLREGGGGGGPEPVHRHVPVLWGLGSLPFAGILGAIALLPLIPATHHWWESNRNRLLVSLCCAAGTIAYYLWAEGAVPMVHMLEHAVVHEYIPFIVLLFSLYVISGGINVQGTFQPTPSTNTAILGLGALIASFVGTTGASMLLIRPLLQTNSTRQHITHTVVFFIFLVSNIGGLLLPIGDPPLFLGYLRGVPFLWTFALWKEWAFCIGVLLVVYYIYDRGLYTREKLTTIAPPQPVVRKPLRLSGTLNLVWLAGVVLAVALLDYHQPFPGTDWYPFHFMRELVMLGLVALSLWFTPQSVREENRFNYTAILEVAALFIGIFITMQVPIQVLRAMGDQLGVVHPWQYFWATGVLSSVLDNAPTYVVFFETANALTKEEGEGIIRLLDGSFMRSDLLIAISLGAVFMGANTYIGNGPNFMVKSIAEQSGVRMPTFFGYVFRFTLPFLLPLFIVVTWLFL